MYPCSFLPITGILHSYVIILITLQSVEASFRIQQGKPVRHNLLGGGSYLTFKESIAMWGKKGTILFFKNENWVKIIIHFCTILCCLENFSHLGYVPGGKNFLFHFGFFQGYLFRFCIFCAPSFWVFMYIFWYLKSPKEPLRTTCKRAEASQERINLPLQEKGRTLTASIWAGTGNVSRARPN